MFLKRSVFFRNTKRVIIFITKPILLFCQFFMPKWRKRYFVFPFTYIITVRSFPQHLKKAVSFGTIYEIVRDSATASYRANKMSCLITTSYRLARFYDTKIRIFWKVFLALKLVAIRHLPNLGSATVEGGSWSPWTFLNWVDLWSFFCKQWHFPSWHIRVLFSARNTRDERMTRVWVVPCYINL